MAKYMSNWKFILGLLISTVNDFQQSICFVRPNEVCHLYLYLWIYFKLRACMFLEVTKTSKLPFEQLGISQDVDHDRSSTTNVTANPICRQVFVLLIRDS